MKMKAWIKRVLGSPDEPQINEELNAIDDYVVVGKNELEAILDELQQLRSRSTMEARDLDLLLGDAEAENKRLKRDLEVLTMALRDTTMNGRQ
jgi:hypothetical protein